MNSKKFKRWINVNDHKTCLKIIQKYYIIKESGKRVNLFSGHFITLFIKRLFFVFVKLFANAGNHYFKYKESKNPREFFKRLFGFYKLETFNLLPQASDFKDLSFKPQPQPLVSIIIAVHNNWQYTYNCLLSVLTHTQETEYEIILINDYSSDQTSENIKNIKHITYLENSENLGFLRSCNKAAEASRGKYVCFLNNDTQVTPLWMFNLLHVFNHDPSTGLVGSQFIYPYGLLQEAGGLVDKNGAPSNYGRYEDPAVHQFNYLRETDYCSGASILLLKEDFEILGGFDERYTPAYYEDTDLCFAIRYQLHKKVYYQPLSKIIHFEGISSGKRIRKGNVKEYQLINAEKFKSKWNSVLTTFPESTSNTSIADKFSKKNTILFIDTFLPEYDKNSGSRRIFELIKIFKSLNFNILFLPVDGKRTEPYFSELTNLGVHIIYSRFGESRPQKELKELISKINIAWISRPEHNQFYGADIRSNPAVTWIYDTVDLHFIRMERRLKIENIITEEAIQEIGKIKNEEINLSKRADITVAITEIESKLLKLEGAKKVAVITNIHVPHLGQNKTFAEKKDIIFIGGYDHLPNVDAVIWLAKEIMPRVWKKDPNIKLTLLGSNPIPSILQLRSSNIEVTGYLEDVSEYFISSRICVAPLRYGAGMKGKIGQSLEFSLPVITTDIGAEGMNLTHGCNILLANTTEDFANEILKLYHDENLWNEIASNSLDAIERYSPAHIKNELKNILNLTDF